jgi:glucose-1-phosphate thymidylyltransferase
MAGIREILIITTPEELPAFKRLLGDGTQYGVSFEFATQEKPNGLAEAFMIGEKFIENKSVALILGDNLFYGVGLGKQLENINPDGGATIFAYRVSDPERYGVVEFEDSGNVISLEEKPKKPKSNFAVPGLYFYDSDVVEISKAIQPSVRGELEITSVNLEYLKNKSLSVRMLERGTAWLDTGTFKSLHAASSYVQIIEERQGLKISCLEEIAWTKKWINSNQLDQLATSYGKSDYGIYLSSLLLRSESSL